MSKPTKLEFKGKMLPTAWDEKGNVIAKAPDRFFMGVPARDLDEEDIAQLDATTLKEITGGERPLYVDASPPADAVAQPAREDAAKAGDKPAEAKRG